MTEQERRKLFNKLTGRAATTDELMYLAFCKGIEVEREECAKKAERMANGRSIAAAIRARSNVEVSRYDPTELRGFGVFRSAK